MAGNDTTLADQDGDFSDWIELYNPDRVATNLNGWYLTDNASNLKKWRFPAVTLGPRSNLLVFASGKNRANVTNELHTNFSLSKDGEFLALVRPDGTNTSTRFAPEYPAQEDDYSYGVTLPVEDVVFAATGTFCRAIVPTNHTPGTWCDLAFDDSAWPTGAYAVGYFNSNASPNYAVEVGLNVQQMYTNRNSVFIRSRFAIANTNDVHSMTLRMRYDDGYAIYLNGRFVVKSANAPAAGILTNTSAASSTHAATLYETNIITAAVTNLVNGTNVLAIHGLNVNATSSDAFLLPHFAARVLSTNAPQTNYFLRATPGQANGGNETIQLPQTVSFSVPSGVFTASFACAMSGEGDGQTIRYTTDGSVPTSTSTVYASPLLIATTRTFRAAVFSASGQTGRVTSVRYTFLSGGALSFTSNLPLLILANIDPARQGAITLQDVKVACFAHLIDRDTNGSARLAGPTVVNGRAGVSVRGSSSAGNPKKPYALEFWTETNEDQDRALLDMQSDSDWVLLGPYNFDRSFMHDTFMYEVSRQMGRWAPRTRYLEAFLAKTNGMNVTTNDYIGLYVLEEKIKVGPNRVDIDKMDGLDTAMPDVSGGHLFKIDRKDADEFGWRTIRGIPTNTIAMLVLTSLKAAELLPSQRDYLTNAVQQFEDALYGATFTNPVTGYAPHIDRAAWIDHHILNVMPKNVDGLRLSGYYHKDRLEPIAAGPVWDFDRSLDSYDGRDDAFVNWNGTGDATLFFDYCWWTQLFRDPDFWQAWVDRWQDLRSSVLTATNCFAIINGFAAEIGTTAPARDYARWGLPPIAGRGGSFTGEVAWLKTWLTNRMNWIDTQFTARATALQPSGVVTAGTTVAFAGTNLYVATDGDPRAAGGAISSTALPYTGPLVISTTTFVTVRSLVGTNWSGPVSALYLVDEDFATAGDLAVSELDYNPLAATPAENALLPYVQPSDFEFLELRNIGGRRVNLYGVTLEEDRPVSALTLGAFTLAPGESVVVCANSAALQARHGTDVVSRVAATWADGTLSDAGERWTLRDRAGAVIESASFADGGVWPGRADGGGSSLEYAIELWDSASRSNGANWRSSSELHGSPGWAGAGPDRRVVINELMTHTDLPLVDAIELFNTTTNDVDLGGWFLCDAVTPETAADYAKYRIADGTILTAGTYRVFDATQFDPNGIWNTNAGTPGAGEFAFDAAHGDEAWLLRGDAGGQPVAFVDHVTFAASRNGESLGRWPDGSGPLYPMATQTLFDAASTSSPLARLGASNSIPRVGPLLISEAHPVPIPGNTNDNPFIEVFNTGTNVQPLNQWTLRGDADFTFGSNHTLAAGGVLVVVPFSPTDTVRVAAFQSAYGLSNTIVLAGPWQSGDTLRAVGRIELNRADEPPPEEPDFHPQIPEEEVAYSNAAPWPATDGTGRSLTRIGTTTVSRLPESWLAEVPTPGRIGVTYAAWRAALFATNAPAGVAVADPDSDGLANLAEFVLGFDPNAPASETTPGLLRAGGQLFYGFQQPLNRLESGAAIQRSTDLTNWTDIADTLLDANNATATRGVAVPQPGSETNLFFRTRFLPLP